MEVNSEAPEIFKVPDHKLKKKVFPKNNDNQSNDCSEVEDCPKVKQVPNYSENKNLTIKDRKNIQVDLAYNEPDWGGNPPNGFGFEVLKCGTIISNVPVNSSVVVFGRLDNCNVVLEHPSVSRFHAVLQYCPKDKTHPKGFYLYDLGSTHGTFLNKKQIESKVYCQVKVGHVIRFGGSSRMYILHGPDEEDDDNDSSVEKARESEVCDWGMAEDAEEEDDLMENPYALSTANEELYLDDPKKSLRGWFEREGYDLEYIVEEKDFRTFSCKVQLPIDTLTGEFPYAEASVTGKKKEAVIACALEACRILDRRGLLRQAQHESKKKKRKNWEDDDFYDSDEDTYLDRTGVIEKKREIRKRLVTKPETETHQSLTSKLENVIKNISEIEVKLQSCTADAEMELKDEEQDSLEMYMSQIKNDTLDKVTKSKLRLDLASLQQERARLEKLVNITKPTPLPPLIKTSPFIGKRPTKKLTLPPAKKIPVKVEGTGAEEEEEEDDEEEDLKMEIDEKQKTKVTVFSEKEGLQNFEQVKVESEKTDKIPKVKETIYNEEEITLNSVKEKVSVCSKKANILQNPESSNVKNKVTKRNKKETDIYVQNNADYSMWVPPDNQTGDGKTSLNAKYGY